MHADFRIGGLKPKETQQIRGKLYVVAADEATLLKRFRIDFPDQASDDRRKKVGTNKVCYRSRRNRDTS